MKQDTLKTRWDLVPWEAMYFVAEALTQGAREHDDYGWKTLPFGRRRYFSAAMRHMLAWKAGRELDAQSGMPHLAHAICCLLFLLARDLSPSQAPALVVTRKDTAE